MLEVQQSGMPDDFASLALIHSEIEEIWWLQNVHVWSTMSAVLKSTAGLFHLAAAVAAYRNLDRENKMFAAIGTGVSALGDGAGAVATNEFLGDSRES